jgi:hypothetical protein
MTSAVLAGNAIEPDYYGIFIASKSGPVKELRSLSGDMGAADQKVLMDTMTDDSGAYVILFKKDVNPNEYTLVYFGNPLKQEQSRSEVEVIVKPKGGDRYHIIPRSPLSPGVYLLQKFMEPSCGFIIGDNEMKRTLSAESTRSAQNMCINHLRQIEAAKEQWALANRKASGSAVALDEAGAYIKDPASVTNCPVGGQISIGRVGENAKCTIPGHDLNAPVQRPPTQAQSQTRVAPQAAQHTCINNLRQIEAAKEQWALVNKKMSGDAVVERDVLTYVRYPDAATNCPAGGKVSFCPIGENARCTVPGHEL